MRIIKEKINSLNLKGDFDKKVLFTRDSNVKIPSIEKIQEIFDKEIDSIKFYFCPQVEFSSGITCNINIYSGRDFICLNDLKHSDVDSKEQIEQLLELFNSNNGEWLQEVLFKNNIDITKFHDEIRTHKISSRFLLSFLTDENIEFIRNNSITLGIGKYCDECTIDGLIELAKDDDFVVTYEDRDT